MSYAPNGAEPPRINGNFIRENDNNSPRLDTGRKSNRNSRSRERGTPYGSASNPNIDPADCPIIVHSHLCWDWVWQRPQQFVSRLSLRHPVLFVETVGPDPQLSSPVARFHTPESLPNITVLRLQFPAWRWNDGAYVDRERRRLVREFLSGPGAGRFNGAVQWFYDPMAVTAFAGRMGESLTVYDCMDELSQFKCAPPEIQQREAKLLAIADVVFAGGRRLCESKRRSNPNCYFYGCGVDVAHFSRALDARLPVPADIASLPRPVLGYFGVVDERMDYELLSMLAVAFRAGSVVMVGPVFKVEPSSLPVAPNIHWLGQRAYSELPACCKAFDVCLMPFALNESTEFINPTKALEYMAAGREIVSTAVPDVVTNFGSIVKIAQNRPEFVQFCENAVREPDRDAIQRGLDMAAGNSWESIVTQLEARIAEAFQRKRSVEVSA